MVLRFEGSKSNRFPLDIGQNMYKMYIKEELQSTLILMLVKTGQQNGALKKILMDTGELLTWSIKGYLHVNVGYVPFHLVAYSTKVELTGS